MSRVQISKIIQSGGFLGSLLSKLVDPLMKVAVSVAKNILAPLGITAAASTIDAGIKKKQNNATKEHGSGTSSILSNKGIDDIMKIVQALEDYNILLEGVTKTIESDSKNQESGFLGMLLSNLEDLKGKRNVKSWLWK